MLLHTQDNGRNLPAVRRSVARLADLVGLRVFAEFLVGDKGIGALWTVAPRLLSVMAPVIVVVAFATLLPRADARHRVLAAALFLYAVLLFIVPVWSRGTNALYLTPGEPFEALVGRALGPASSHPGEEYVSISLRYSVVPVFLLASGLAVLVGASTWARSGWVVRIGRALFVAHVVTLIAIGFSVSGARSERRDWPTTVTRTYKAHCVGQSPDKRVAVSTDPLYFFVFQPVTLRCRELQP